MKLFESIESKLFRLQRMLNIYGTNILSIGIFLIIDEINIQIENIIKDFNKRLKPKNFGNLIVFSMVSDTVKCIKNGPKVNDPILFIYFLFNIWNIKLLFSFTKRNNAQEYKIEGKFKYPLWILFIFLYLKYKICVPIKWIKKDNIPNI